MSKTAYQKGPPPILGINICPIALLREPALSLDVSSQAMFKVKCPSFTPTQVVWHRHRRLSLYMLSTLFLVRFGIAFICQTALDHQRPHHHHTRVDILTNSLLISCVRDLMTFHTNIVRSGPTPNKMGAFKAGLIKMYNNTPPTIFPCCFFSS